MIVRRLVGLLVLSLIAVACSPGPGTGGELQGTKWILQSYRDDSGLAVVAEGLYADAEFVSQRVRGFAGCNEFDALYRSGGRTLLISEAAVTFRACDEETSAFESTYLQLLHESRFFSVRRNDLTIFDGEGTAILVFDAAPRNPLLGRWNVDSYATAPNSLSAPIEGTALTAIFGIKTVGGSAGCNTYTGSYESNGDVVRISNVATTRLACEQDIMDQETAFLAALQGVARVERRGPTLLLTNIQGAIEVALVRPAAAEADASASPSIEPSASPSPSPSSSPTPSPSPSPSPTPSPTATAAPTAPPIPVPTITPPPSAPATASCDLVAAGASIATISYPQGWFTLTTPADLACRFFDPSAITVPADPTTLTTAVMIETTATAYADAVAAATDPANWNVTRTAEVTIDGLSATAIEAVATTDASGVPVGMSRFAYLIDYGDAGTLAIETAGMAGDQTFISNAAVVSLMAATSTFTPS